MVTPTRPAKFGPFNLGVNTRAADTDLDAGRDGTYLRAGVNVDLTAEGRLKRRKGYAMKLAGTNMHSLFTTASRGFVVDGPTLYELVETTAGMDKATVRTGLRPSTRLSYVEKGADTLYSDGVENRRITPTDERPLSIATPNPQPQLYAAEGQLEPGLYQVCMTFVDDHGRMSGSTTPTQVMVGALVGEDGVPAEVRGGFDIVGLPTSFPPNVVAARLYMTPLDGDTFFWFADLHAPVGPGDVLQMRIMPQLGHECPTFMLDPLPAGGIIRRSWGGARVLVARDDTLYYSDPFSDGLYNPVGGYVRFETAIAVVEAAEGGIYVATQDKTYQFNDDLSISSMQLVLPYGGVAGTGGASPDRKVCWWMTPRGMVRAGPEGVVNLQEKAVAVDGYLSGASMFREHDGMKQIVSSLFNAETTGASAYSYFDAEIIRKGTKL